MFRVTRFLKEHHGKKGTDSVVEQLNKSGIRSQVLFKEGKGFGYCVVRMDMDDGEIGEKEILKDFSVVGMN